MRSILTAIAMIITLPLFGQDLIVIITGDTITGQILSVTTSDIKYVQDVVKGTEKLNCFKRMGHGNSCGKETYYTNGLCELHQSDGEKSVSLIHVATYFTNGQWTKPKPIDESSAEYKTIEIKKNFGTVFIQKGKILAPRQLLEVTKVNPEAHEEMQIAISNHDVGAVFSISGGFLVGWTLGAVIGQSLGGAEANWSIGIVGAGLIVVSIPFSTAYTKHAKKAVNIYNEGLSQTGLRTFDLNFGVNADGIGMKLTF